MIGGPTGAPAESTPMSMVVLYRAAFRHFNLGYAAALAMPLFAAMTLVTRPVVGSARPWVRYEGAPS